MDRILVTISEEMCSSRITHKVTGRGLSFLAVEYQEETTNRRQRSTKVLRQLTMDIRLQM